MFVSLLRNQRRSVIEPNPRELLLALCQLETRTEIEAHHGTGKKCLNGLLVRTSIQGTKQEEIVELPDSLLLRLPIYVARPAIEVSIDLSIETTGAHEVVVSLASGDIETAKWTAFEQIFEELRGLLKKGTFALGDPLTRPWSYLKSPATEEQGKPLR
jgi:hypothetical protein